MSGSAIGILVLLVTLMLCALLFGTLQGQTDQKIAALNSSEATASYSNIKTTGYTVIHAAHCFKRKSMPGSFIP